VGMYFLRRVGGIVEGQCSDPFANVRQFILADKTCKSLHNR